MTQKAMDPRQITENGLSIESNEFESCRRVYHSGTGKTKSAETPREDIKEITVAQSQVLDATYLKPPESRGGPLSKCSAISMGDFASLDIPFISMIKNWPICLSGSLMECRLEPTVSVLVSHCSGLKQTSLFQLEISVDNSGPRRSGWYEAGREKCSFHTAFKFYEKLQNTSIVRIAIWEKHTIRGNQLKGEITIPLNKWNRDSQLNAQVLFQSDIPLAQKINFCQENGGPRITYAVIIHRDFHFEKNVEQPKPPPTPLLPTHCQSRVNTPTKGIGIYSPRRTSMSKKKLTEVLVPKILQVLRRASPSPINYYRCQTPNGADGYKSAPSSLDSRDGKASNDHDNDTSIPQQALPPSDRFATPQGHSGGDKGTQSMSALYEGCVRNSFKDHHSDQDGGGHKDRCGDQNIDHASEQCEEHDHRNDNNSNHMRSLEPPPPLLNGDGLTRKLFLKNDKNDDGPPSEDDFWTEWVLRTKSEVDGDSVSQGISAGVTAGEGYRDPLWANSDRREIAQGVQSSISPHW